MESVPDITPFFIFATFAASFLACFFSSLAGGGAGLILLPILLFTGLPFVNALSSNKLAVAFIGVGSGSRFFREKLIDWKVFWWTALSGMPFVILGTKFSEQVDGDLMKPLIGLVILAIVTVSLIKKAGPEIFDPRRFSWKIALIASLILIPAAFYSGWISAGAGVFTTFIYLYLMRYDQLHATAMTLTANGIFWNGVGAISHIFLGHVVWAIAPGLIIGALVGSYLGASLAVKSGNKFLRMVFLSTATVTAILLLRPTILSIL